MASGGAEPGPAGPEDNNDQLKQLLYQLAADKETAKLKIADPDFFHGDAKTLRTWIYSATTNFRKALRSPTAKNCIRGQQTTRKRGSMGHPHLEQETYSTWEAFVEGIKTAFGEADTRKQREEESKP